MKKFSRRVSSPSIKNLHVPLRTVLVGWGLAGSSLCSYAQAAQPIEHEAIKRRSAYAKLSLERIRLPGSETMGLVGTTYLLGLGNNFFVGPGFYGAVSGQRGGFFTAGVELAWTRPLTGPVGLELGIYAGGGGGGNAPVGGGLMLRPHADLWWALGANRWSLSISKVRFPNGSIDSHQIGLGWSRTTDFRYFNLGHASAEVAAAKPTQSHDPTGLGIDRVRIVAGAYRPPGQVNRLSGVPLSSTIGFVGMRMEQAIGANKTYWWGIEANGAASGGAAGYAEYLATLAAESSARKSRFQFGGRLAVGMGGGGDVPTGGGLLVKGGLYGVLQLSPMLAVNVEVGLAQAPQGNFKAPYVSALLNWSLNERSASAEQTTSLSPIARTEWVGGIEHYDANRLDGTRQALKTVSMRVNRFVGPNLYLSGQARSAFDGKAGGYSVGLVGLGLRTPLIERWHAGIEGMVGAGGGGGVNTKGGALAQSMAYVGYDLSPSLSLHLGAGRVKAMKGPLNATVVEAALSFNYGVWAQSTHHRP